MTDKAVLISIQPSWCELIETLKKEVDIRKTKPSLELPFRCYIYCTQGFKFNTPYSYKTWAGRGKVIGEFVCDSIAEWRTDPQSKGYFITTDELALTQLTYEQLHEYGNGQALYGWHISDLVIYDKPKELSEFFLACNKPKGTDCSVCYERRENRCKSLKRPPQSWCYVEVMK